MQEKLVIRTLGGLQIQLDDQDPIRFAARRAEVLITYLAYQQGPIVRADLAKMFFEDRETAQAMANLRSLFAQLPMAIKPYLDIGRKEVHTRAGNITIDAVQFEQALTHTTSPADQAEALQSYRGDFLNGVFVRDSQAIESWIYNRREYLRQLALDTHQALAYHHFYRQAFSQALIHAQALLQTVALREAHYRLMIRILTRRGQPVAALEQFAACAKMMNDEFGLPPEPETVRMRDRVEALRHRSAPLLPGRLTPFVGRKAELAELDQALDQSSSRLITLSGPGGAGKTRLAAQLASIVRGDFLDGVAFVGLADLQDVAEIPAAIAAALDIKLSGSKAAIEQVLDQLRHQERLLVLDNMEHLLPGCTQLVHQLLDRTTALYLLITSRRPLDLNEEVVYPIRGLDAGSGSDDAEQLFEISARRAAADFQLTVENRSAVHQICRLLDGLPLGIELAAAWSALLTPADIVAEIGAGLDMLESQLYGRPDRHRSLHAVFDYSWRYLSEVEQAAMQQLAGFRGGFSRQAAREIAGISGPTLRSLVSHSLLQEQPELERYQMLIVVRQYVAEIAPLSGSVDTTFRHAHLACFAAQMTSQAEPSRPVLPVDLENVRMAWMSAVALVQPDALAAIMDGLVPHYLYRGPFSDISELFDRAARGLEHEADSGRVRTRIYAQLARFLVLQGSYEQAIDVAAQGVEAAEQLELPDSDARARLHWGQALQAQGHYEHYDFVKRKRSWQGGRSGSWGCRGSGCAGRRR